MSYLRLLWTPSGHKGGAARLRVDKSPVSCEYRLSVALQTNFSIMRLFPLLVLFAISAVTYTQQDPIQDFCRRHQHQTCVIDNKLYIDGGKVYYGGTVENGSTAQQSKFTMSKHKTLADEQTNDCCGKMCSLLTTRPHSRYSTKI